MVTTKRRFFIDDFANLKEHAVVLAGHKRRRCPVLVAAPQIGAFQAVSRIYFTTPPAVDSKAATVRAPLPESPSAALLGTAEGAAQ